MKVVIKALRNVLPSCLRDTNAEMKRHVLSSLSTNVPTMNTE